MSEEIVQDFEYIAAHLDDYINDDKLFSVFETEDIIKILKLSHLTANDFINLLKQSPYTIKTNDLYKCTRKTNVSIQNFEEVVSLLKCIKRYLKLGILDGVIDILKRIQHEMSDSAEQIQQLQTYLQTVKNQKQQFQTELQTVKNQKEQLQTELQTVKNQKEQLQTDLQTVSNQNKQLQTELQTIKNQKEQLQTDLQTVSNQKQPSGKEIKSLNISTQSKYQWRQ
ncbi:hypothetical protein TVAG_136120 [Trichomonas vaginalis G3]|uniref:Uncharacterized protein n=1 Tax=Trichomonas vaginalis (strain ATCC PRA-98 / G3) TaxID=412133 RepID=A2DJ94_TRIV3|nr:ankyrin repeats (many copies)-containing protein [Trichomonas vaginalis G3]EAY19481.1 hypothetical protein TVAG_136120 [Trichomonas vaginalis G3]KAI5520040.1 ankyrin repeats (many copies)-containing protein [Trichomonas vaginalis G3]|eukprot:XP_001580467.1 hypothetical protein [Trichomonas vaginalis G3]